jgi:hypothetical protein
MTIQWTVFVPGVLLLLFPADRLLSPLVELRSFDRFQNLENSPRYRPWWWVPALWLDPLRGFAGAWLLLQAFGLTSVKWETAPVPEYAGFVVLIGLGVLCQTLTRRGDEGILLAPIGFVAGVVVAVAPWAVSAMGIVSATLGLFAFRQFNAYFAIGSVAVAVLGLVLSTDAMWLWPASGAFALPLLAALVSGCTLELPTRDSSRLKTAAGAGR